MSKKSRLETNLVYSVGGQSRVDYWDTPFDVNAVRRCLVRERPEWFGEVSNEV